METEKLIAFALVSVVCIEPIRFNGTKYAPGSTITGLTEKQAEQLVMGSHAELVRRDFAAEQAAADEAAAEAEATQENVAQAAADQAKTDAEALNALAPVAAKATAKKR